MTYRVTLTHTGWSLDCLQEWGPFAQLAVPSMLMLCLEWWVVEVGGFLAGVISEAELGAHSISYELTVTAYMVTPVNLLTFAYMLTWHYILELHMDFPTDSIRVC